MSALIDVVAGAGIAGLTAAVALGRRGIRSTVFERQPEPREHASAIQIFVNGKLALHELGLGDRLERISRPVHDYRFRSWRGNLLFELPVAEIARGQDAPPPGRRPAAGSARASPRRRRRLRRALGRRLRRLRTGGRQRPASSLGRERGARRVPAGADGTDSVVRRQLAPEATAAFRRLPVPARADALRPRADYDFSVTFGRGDRFLFHDLGDRWEIGRIASWSNPVACTLREQLMRRVVSRAMRRGMEAELGAHAAA